MLKIGLRLLLLTIALGAYWAATQALFESPRKKQSDDVLVYLPPVVQLIGAAGDRYLAANVDVYRIFAAGAGPMPKEAHAILAQLHADAALFSPGHEDNYYVAGTLLPWVGHVGEAQYVLARAMKVRPYDYMPAFLHAFNQRRFYKDAAGAVATLREAATRVSDERNRLALEALAAHWLERSAGSGAAVVLRAMAEQTRNPAFAKHLQMRATRLEAIAQIESALEQWARAEGAVRPKLEDLVKRGYLEQLPEDPFGGSFTLSPEGKVTVIERRKGA